MAYYNWKKWVLEGRYYIVFRSFLPPLQLFLRNINNVLKFVLIRHTRLSTETVLGHFYTFNTIFPDFLRLLCRRCCSPSIIFYRLLFIIYLFCSDGNLPSPTDGLWSEEEWREIGIWLKNTISWFNWIYANIYSDYYY